MKYIVVIVMVLLFSCTQAKKNTDVQTLSTPGKPVIPEDTMVTKLRTKLLADEVQELQTASVVKQIKLDSVQFNKISLKEFYTIQKEELTRVFHFSTNKEKTTRALTYLDKMIAKSSNKATIYAVQFHLNALLANTTLYNEHHVKYLREDLSEINIVFP